MKYDRSTATLISSADIEKTGEEIKLLSMEKRSLEDKLPGIAAMFRLLDVCLENCLDVISGQKGYADVMFPAAPCRWWRASTRVCDRPLQQPGSASCKVVYPAKD